MYWRRKTEDGRRKTEEESSKFLVLSSGFKRIVNNEEWNASGIRERYVIVALWGRAIINRKKQFIFHYSFLIFFLCLNLEQRYFKPGTRNSELGTFSYLRTSDFGLLTDLLQLIYFYNFTSGIVESNDKEVIEIL